MREGDTEGEEESEGKELVVVVEDEFSLEDWAELVIDFRDDLCLIDGCSISPWLGCALSEAVLDFSQWSLLDFGMCLFFQVP